MNKPKQTDNAEVSFDWEKWRSQSSINDKVFPKSHFPDASNHPFFKMKLEQAMERIAKNPEHFKPRS